MTFNKAIKFGKIGGKDNYTRCFTLTTPLPHFIPQLGDMHWEQMTEGGEDYRSHHLRRPVSEHRTMLPYISFKVVSCLC